MSRLQLAIEQIVFARNYTIRLLDHTKPDDWFRLPPGGVKATIDRLWSKRKMP